MKAQIGRKSLNTETAIKIVDIGDVKPKNSLDWQRGAIYRSPVKGYLFIAGDGGPYSIFGKLRVTGFRTGKAVMVLITPKEAIFLAKKYGNKDISEDIVKLLVKQEEKKGKNDEI